MKSILLNVDDLNKAIFVENVREGGRFCKTIYHAIDEAVA